MEENERIKIENNSENNVNQQNSNSETKIKNKKLTIILVSLIIILILAIGICVGLWFAGDTIKVINKNEEKTQETQEEVKIDENDTTEEEKHQQNDSKKIDETKPWVYNAEYLGEREDKQRTNQYTGEIYKVSKNLVAPYININSEYAKKVNEEILSLYNECYNKFGTATGYDAATGVQNTDPDVAYILNYLEYEFFETNNILSILITKTEGVVPGDFGKEHYIYNINLKTLNEASFEDVYKECGFKSESEVNEKIDITLTNAKNNDEIFQDTVWDTGMFYIGKNNLFNIIVEGHVNRISLEVKTDAALEQKEEVYTISQSYIGDYLADEAADFLTIKSIDKNVIKFDLDIYRISGFEDAVAVLINNNTARFSTYDIAYNKKVEGTLEFLNNNVILKVTNSECEYINSDYKINCSKENYNKYLQDASVKADDYYNELDVTQKIEEYYRLFGLKETNPISMLNELGLEATVVQDSENVPSNYIEHPEGYTWTGILYSDFKKAMWFVSENVLSLEFSEIKEYKGYLYISNTNRVNNIYDVEIANIRIEEDGHKAICEAWVIKNKNDVHSEKDLVTIELVRGNGDFVINSISMG